MARLLPVLLAMAACFAMSEAAVQQLEELELDTPAPASETPGTAEHDKAEESKAQIAQDEISTLGGQVVAALPEIKGESGVGSAPPKPRWHKDARAMMDRIQALHQKLQKRSWELSRKLSEPPKDEKQAVLPYKKIAGMFLRANSKMHENMPNVDACQLTCSMDQRCWSYSYNAGSKECLITPGALGYSPDATFYSKSQADDGTVKYHMYPGMFESNPMGEPLKTTKDQCELSCNEVAACEGFSYRENTEMCSKTGEKLSYNAAWMYAEKPPRTWKHGHPEDMKDLKEVDDSEGRSESFIKQFKFNRDTSGTRKAATMTARVNGMVTKSRASEVELRSLKTAIVSAEAKAAGLITTSSKLVDSGRAISTRVETINGRIKAGNNNIHLAQSEISRIMTKLTADRKRQQAASLQIDKDGKKIKLEFDDPPVLKELRSNIQNMKLKQIEEAGKLEECETDQADLRVEIQHLDGHQIKALEALKKMKESFVSKRTALKMLVIDAKHVKKIVDKEFSFTKPPAFEPVKPGTYLNSWNDKADAAKAHIAADKLERMEGGIMGKETFGMRHGKIKFGEKLAEPTVTAF